MNKLNSHEVSEYQYELIEEVAGYYDDVVVAKRILETAIRQKNQNLVGSSGKIKPEFVLHQRAMREKREKAGTKHTSLALRAALDVGPSGGILGGPAGREANRNDILYHGAVNW